MPRLKIKKSVSIYICRSLWYTHVVLASTFFLYLERGGVLAHAYQATSIGGVFTNGRAGNNPNVGSLDQPDGGEGAEPVLEIISWHMAQLGDPWHTTLGSMWSTIRPTAIHRGA